MPNGKPNILVIWGDDIGQSNLSCYTRGLMGYRIPKLFNLRTDPYEFADQTSNTYYDWFLYNACFIYAAQTGAAMLAASFKDFPPIQRPGSFTIDDAVAKMADAGAGAS
jgi:arylsulfatase